jgi:hypothetical protein
MVDVASSDDDDGGASDRLRAAPQRVQNRPSSGFCWPHRLHVTVAVASWDTGTVDADGIGWPLGVRARSLARAAEEGQHDSRPARCVRFVRHNRPPAWAAQLPSTRA